MAADRAPVPETNPRPSPASPGDSRGADDVDGNKAGGASKSTGPNDPKPAVGERNSGDRDSGEDRAQSKRG